MYVAENCILYQVHYYSKYLCNHLFCDFRVKVVFFLILILNGDFKAVLGSIFRYLIDTSNVILDFCKHEESLVFVNLKGKVDFGARGKAHRTPARAKTGQPAKLDTVSIATQ